MGKSKELRGLVPIFFKPDASPEVPPTHEFQKNYVHLCVNIYVPTCKLNLLNYFFFKKKHKLFLDQPQIKIVSMVEEHDQ